MTPRPTPPSRTIDWTEVHARLERARATSGDAGRSSPERARAVMDERARSLARAPDRVPDAALVGDVAGPGGELPPVSGRVGGRPMPDGFGTGPRSASAAITLSVESMPTQYVRPSAASCSRNAVTVPNRLSARTMPANPLVAARRTMSRAICHLGW